MSAFEGLTNQFLIAMPELADPNFERTVTLICQHDENGALGIVINRPTQLTLGDVFQQLDLPADKIEKPDSLIFNGGPVHIERGLVLHNTRGEWDSSLQVSDDLTLTTSRDVLEAMATNQGPEKCLMALGYAGWGGGQLENEMRQNAWLSGPADEDIIFQIPVADRWTKAAQQLGVDLSLISSQVGHA